MIRPKPDFSWFYPNRQPTPEARIEAQQLLDYFVEWTGQTKGTKPFFLVAGGFGTGKSDLMSSSVLQMAQAGLRPYYITASDTDAQYKEYLNQSRNFQQPFFIDPETWLRRLAAVPILAFDDIGAGVYETDFVLSKLEFIFTYRYQNQLPTLASTNLSAEGLNSAVGGRVFSRFMDTRIGHVIALEHCHDMRPLL